MQRLIPLEVPWQVSPSTPFLRLLAEESGSGHPTQITFVGHFGLRSGGTTDPDVGFATSLKASSPYGLSSQAEPCSKTHSVVRIEFEAGMWVRMSPAYSDRVVIDPHEFDDSFLPYSGLTADVETWLRNFHSHWLKSGNCPDPGAYFVESSQWAAHHSRSGFRHFLIKGHDAYIEVLARDWKWEEIQKLPDWW